MNSEEYYNTLGEKEWKRLVKNAYMRLEFETTKHFLKKYLPAKGKILDAGGGPGRYSIYLMENDYKVTLMDISEKQLEIAKKKIVESGMGDRIERVIKGTISDIHHCKNGEFDAVLCLGGALSHIFEKDEREEAARELIRVAKDGAPIFVSVIGRLAVVKHELTKNQKEIIGQPKIFRKIYECGDYEGLHTFTPSHYFMSDELRNMFKRRCDISEMVGLEGLASHHEKDFANLVSRSRGSWKTWWSMHLKTCTNNAVVDTSEHILLVCKKTSQ